MQKPGRVSPSASASASSAASKIDWPLNKLEGTTNHRPLMVARNVKTSTGGASIVVADNYEGGTGRVHEIVVFGRCKLSTGGADIVYHLATTEIAEGTGSIGEYRVCEENELIELAIKLGKLKLKDNEAQDRVRW